MDSEQIKWAKLLVGTEQKSFGQSDVLCKFIPCQNSEWSDSRLEELSLLQNWVFLLCGVQVRVLHTSSVRDVP